MGCMNCGEHDVLISRTRSSHWTLSYADGNGGPSHKSTRLEAMTGHVNPYNHTFTLVADCIPWPNRIAREGRTVSPLVLVVVIPGISGK